MSIPFGGPSTFGKDCPNWLMFGFIDLANSDFMKHGGCRSRTWELVAFGKPTCWPQFELDKRCLMPCSSMEETLGIRKLSLDSRAVDRHEDISNTFLWGSLPTQRYGVLLYSIQCRSWVLVQHVLRATTHSPSNCKQARASAKIRVWASEDEALRLV